MVWDLVIFTTLRLFLSIEGKANLLNGIVDELNAELEDKEDEKIKIEEQKLNSKPKI